MIRTIYPDKATVSPQTVIGWWADVCSDEPHLDDDFDDEAEDALYEAIIGLQDAGLVTFDASVAPLLAPRRGPEPRAE